jgi:hypothetical protein
MTVVVPATTTGNASQHALLIGGTGDSNVLNNGSSVLTTVGAAPTPPTNCHPTYPKVCIPPPRPDLDCTQISQRSFQVIYTVPDPDPHLFATTGTAAARA